MPDNIPVCHVWMGSQRSANGAPTAQPKKKKIKSRLRPLFEKARVGFPLLENRTGLLRPCALLRCATSASTVPTARSPVLVQGQVSFYYSTSRVFMASWIKVVKVHGHGHGLCHPCLSLSPNRHGLGPGTDVAVNPMAVNRFQGWVAAGW